MQNDKTLLCLHDNLYLCCYGRKIFTQHTLARRNRRRYRSSKVELYFVLKRQFVVEIACLGAERGAVLKRVGADADHAIGDDDALEIVAPNESAGSNAHEAGREDGRRERCTVLEGVVAEAGDAVGHGDA